MSSEVIHDAFGIPHIRADSLEELAFAQGHEMARARAAQIELERLRSEGGTAAHLGPAGLEWDRFSRRAGIDALAQRAFDTVDDETRDFLVAFTDGINVAFRDRRWMPWTPLGVFLVQQVQFGSYPSKLWRDRVARRLGPAGLRALSVEPPAAAGSNAFALTGARTATGSPIVAGDPHRVFEAPNVYLQTHLACPDFDVVGFTFPGVPGIQHFGHTGSVAWGLTNAMGDYQDLYAEQLEVRDGVLSALGPDGWAPVEVREETIDVLDDEPEVIEVVVTERGPIVFDDQPVALRTASYALGDLGFGALLPLLRSRSVTEVEAALEHWVEPLNNWVVADTAGVVRHRVAGRVPERDLANRFGIVPAAEPRHVWTGWVDEMPVVDPGDQGRVVTANERTTPAYDAISSHFAEPWRADRISQLLDERDDWSADDAIRPLTDVRQLGAEALLEALAALPEVSPTAELLRGTLAAWDLEMAVDSPGAAVFNAVREQFVHHLCGTGPLQRLADVDVHGVMHRPWLSTASRVGQSIPQLLVHGHELDIDVPALLRASLEAAATDVRPWGERHGFGPLTGLAQFGLDDEAVPVAGVPLPGDASSVAANGWIPGTDTAVRGPVARYVWDLADRDRSRWAVPLGSSGVPGSPHEADQFEAWASGTLLPVTTDWKVLREDAARRSRTTTEQDR
ncbi:penicillin acylase family protein [Nocardioides sp. JQ2195]|uniref:penicillin acylase family protein n=1 Tax=Nocardioides sp. JQ2195 TaxID=2592334 RepID=UPI00143E2647|nr:penicillin acylase family protein [Nocardioides sp. JQ2195]QIX28376.1 penicillin acylase family protein [Nocardioides sp. JQ2195]